MALQFGLNSETFNTQYAPLGALIALYKQNQVFDPLKKVDVSMKSVEFSTSDKLEQVIVSILANCTTLSEVNTKLKHDLILANACGWQRIADQSTLSLMLDALTQMNIEQLRRATDEIWHDQSGLNNHDWRGHLWIDYDLSGLVCSQNGELAEKGYFSGKKTALGVN